MLSRQLAARNLRYLIKINLLLDDLSCMLVWRYFAYRGLTGKALPIWRVFSSKLLTASLGFCAAFCSLAFGICYVDK